MKSDCTFITTYILFCLFFCLFIYLIKVITSYSTLHRTITSYKIVYKTTTVRLVHSRRRHQQREREMHVPHQCKSIQKNPSHHLARARVA